MRAHATRPLAWVVAALLAVFWAPSLGAQQAEQRVSVLLSADPENVPHQTTYQSPFQLQGLADLAFGAIRNRGNHINRMNNDGTINYTQGSPVGILITGTPRGSITPYFLADFFAAVPRGDWEKARQLQSSLDNVLGGGYSVVYNENTGFFPRKRQWRPSDDQFGRVHSGVSSTTDGTCTQHAFLAAGNPLMAINDCPPTWGSEQFAGAARKTTLQQWVQYFGSVNPNEFTWDWWRVPETYVSDELMGDAQSYYTFIDWAADRLPNFGNVIPGGGEPPTETGWPLGLSVKTDVFSFSLPAVADAAIYQMLIINESEKVYGVGLDYDSLYVGNGHGVLFQNQSGGHYWRPELGAILLTNNGVNQDCNGAIVPAGVAGCSYPMGLNNGGTAIVFLKSPIGDLRNKLFTRPESPFYAPAHPLRGDTITFNHGRRCHFGACYTNALDFSERSEFGMVASQPQQVLDGRPITQFNDAVWWDIFANVDFPVRTPEFTYYIPGVHDDKPIWDYNKDGNPDTIKVNSCHVRGCVEIFSDTLPGKHSNSRGNLTGMTMAGPFRLAAGDTTGMVLAFVSGTTPNDMLENVHSIINFYLNAYLGPKPPPAPNVVAVNVRPGDRGLGNDLAPPAQVQIFLDDATENWEDPFLRLLADELAGSQLDQDNPWLLDSLRAHATKNVERILVFKSCDLGTSFSADGACDADRLEDENGDPVESGWQPYAIFEVADDGSFPNIFVDAAVTPGVTYVYSFVAESKGFEPLVLARDEDDKLVPQVFERGAPKLRNPLSASTSDPNVVSVYVPASRQLGGTDPTVAFTEEDEFFTSTVNSLVVQITADPPGGSFRAVFGDSVVVRETHASTGVTTTVDLYRTVTTSFDGSTLERFVFEQSQFTSNSPDGVEVNGGLTTTTSDQGTEVITTAFNGLTMVLLDGSNRPILASSQLAGGTTPGTLLARQDFPSLQFLINIDASGARGYVADTWMAPRRGQLEPTRAGGRPDVEWIQASSTAQSDLLGEYALDWEGPAFGPREVFIPNLANPSATEEEVHQSLQARVVAQRTSTAADVAAAIGVDPSDLIDVPLPFKVTNLTTGQPVTVAMRKSGKRATIPIGRLADEIQVAVPENIWVPGEELIFLERRSLPRTATAAGGEEYVVVQNGQPVMVDSLVVTFDPVVLGCESPLTCNPVPASARGGNQGGFLAVDPGMQLRVGYRSALTNRSSFAFEVKPALRGNQVAEASREDLSRIKVVPNPYVFFSEYEQERDSDVARLMFTGLPPQGAITIFTISGQVVQRITFTEQDLAGNGDLFWDMRTMENNDLGAGLYLFVVEGTLPASGRSVRKLGKFVVIR